MFSSTDSPPITRIAFSTPREPISSGRWDGGVHRALFYGAQGVFYGVEAHYLHLAPGPVAPQACTAPRAISSFWAKMPPIIRVGLQDVLRHVEPLGRSSSPSGWRRFQALWRLFRPEALASVTRGLGAGGAFELGDAADAGELDHLLPPALPPWTCPRRWCGDLPADAQRPGDERVLAWFAASIAGTNGVRVPPDSPDNV